MSELPVLVVSYVFPPVGEVGAKRVASFCHYFPCAGIRPVVLTAQEKYYRYQDSSRLPPEGIQIVRTKVQKMPLDYYRSWRERVKVAESDSSLPEKSHSAVKNAPLKRHVLALLQSPDPFWGWYFPAVRAGKGLVRKERIAAIFSSGPPWVSHLVARKIKKYSGLPWIVDFRDPWSYNPNELQDVPGWKVSLDRGMEASCLALADRVTCTTEQMCEFLIRAHPDLPKQKFCALTNGFDDVPDRVERPKRDKKLFLHLGHLYSGRRVDTFCEAVAKLLELGQLKHGSFEVVFVGQADRETKDSALKRTPALFADGTIRFEEPVGWNKAQHLLWEADCLLIFFGSLRLELPAKLFEYLPTGKPVLAVVKSGALSEFLDSTGLGAWADPDDSESIANGLLQVVNRNPRAPEEIVQQLSGRYHIRSLTVKLAEWIRELAEAKVKP